MSAFTIPLPTYQCHKRVQALKIKALVPNPRGYELHFEDERFCPIEVLYGWYHDHVPAPGGYFVVYEDGYTSYSPAAAFEAGYTLVEEAQWTKWNGGESPLAFGSDAFVELRMGSVVRLSEDKRASWLHRAACGDYDIVAYRVISTPSATQAAREAGK